MDTAGDPDRVLVVDDEPGAADLAATYLDRLLDGATVTAETDPAAALERVRGSTTYDCLVSDYDMPGMDGLELLEAVAEECERLPFILFTGKGSEEIASEAISAGVTDYLQKGAGTDQYEVLANRVTNALERRRAVARADERAAALDRRERTIGRYETILGALDDPVFTVGEDGRLAYVNDALCELTGFDRDRLIGADPGILFADGRVPGELRPTAEGTLRGGVDAADGSSAPVADAGDGPGTPAGPTVGAGPDVGQGGGGRPAPSGGCYLTVRTGGGGTATCEGRFGRFDDEVGDGVVCVLRDVTDRVAVERRVRETSAKVTAIHEFAHELSDCDTVDRICERTVSAARELLDFDRCTVSVREGDRVVPRALSENLSTDEVRAFEVGEGVTGRTVAEGETIVVDDLADADDAEPVADGIRSGISVPIGDRGVIQATSGEPNDFDDRDREFAELIASHAREAIERVESERDLRRERDRLAAVFENVPQPAMYATLVDDAVVVEEVNEEYRRTFGDVAVPEPADWATDGTFADDDALSSLREAIEAGDPVEREVRRETTDGDRDFLMNVVPVDAGDPGAYVICADIGEQKRIERTLRRLHEATREMMRADDPEAVAEITARTAMETLGFPVTGVRLYDEDADVLRPTALPDRSRDVLGDRPEFGPGAGLVWRAFETGEPVNVPDLDAVETELDYGDLRSLLVVPVGDHGVIPLGAVEPDAFDDSDEYLARVLAANVEVALDRAERTVALRDRDRRLSREVDRLEEFASVVSHDLRNPLSVAAGRLELAAEKTDGADGEFERVREAHARMEELIDDLLTLARQGQAVDETEPVPLGAAAERAWRTVETGEATLDAPDGGPTVRADPGRLRTLFENLFRNSVEHAGPAPTVTVEPLPDGGFAVADDGRGLAVDPEEAFEYGTSSRTDGTGFGLAIVREIADAHGWAVDVADGSDGARFRFWT